MVHRLKPLLVDSGRNPFQLWLLAICVITGALGLLPLHRTRSSVIELLPPWARALWYAGLLTSGALGLTAAALPMPRSLLLERAAMTLLGGLLGGYSAAVLTLAGGQLPVGAIPLVSAAIAAWWRVWHITHRDLPTLRAALLTVTHPPEDTQP